MVVVAAIFLWSSHGGGDNDDFVAVEVAVVTFLQSPGGGGGGGGGGSKRFSCDPLVHSGLERPRIQTGPLACPFAHSLEQLTGSLAHSPRSVSCSWKSE